MVFGLYDLEQLKNKLFQLQQKLKSNDQNKFILDKDLIFGHITLDDLLPKHEHKYFEFDLSELRIIALRKDSYEIQLVVLLYSEENHAKDIKQKLLNSLREYKIQYYTEEHYIILGIDINETT